MDFIETGTVISGTHKKEDLLEAFVSELERLDKNNSLIAGVRSLQESEWVNIEEEVSYAIDLLCDALTDLAPEGIYFGANIGDGADFGFWSDALLA